ncbi:MAG: Phosphomethylpyrimidine kinase [Acidobacteriales bacterium]|nr:Phosphomethylpyrimidine kinase [Terriglobales bacterium]
MAEQQKSGVRLGSLPIVLSIAGFDPSSGAGVTADIKTIAAHGCYGVTCITALTVQSTQGVFRVEPVSAELVVQTLSELSGDMEFAAIKIGMLGSAAVAEAVASFLSGRRAKNVVLDPVIRSSSGADLLDKAGVEFMRKWLLPLAAVLTPNLDEAESLTGLQVRSVEEMKAAAEHLQRMGARAVVITGGHSPENIDFLRTNSGEEHEYASARIESESTHGTGCAFATSLACNLALGKDLRESVGAAKEFVRQAILRAPSVGQGNGPVI